MFDLLQMLDMRPFGVLAWTIIEREEEIFESDDIRDEHKVMHALWARWILLNRYSANSGFYGKRRANRRIGASL